jgi:hypothetical protein
MVQLRPGDPALDSRPTAAAGDYLVRVTSLVTRTPGKEALEAFGWGAAPRTETLGGVAGLGVHLEVVATTTEAARRFVALCAFQAGFDTGAPALLRDAIATSDPALPRDPHGVGPPTDCLTVELPSLAGRFPDARFVEPGQLTLPLRAGATKITRLEGAVVVDPTTKVQELHVTGDSQGQTVAMEDLRVTVKEWQTGPGTLTVALQWPAPPGRHVLAEDFALVLTDGKEVTASSGSSGNLEANLRFALPPGSAPAAYLRTRLLTKSRLYADLQRLPFVLENLPLP